MKHTLNRFPGWTNEEDGLEYQPVILGKKPPKGKTLAAHWVVRSQTLAYGTLSSGLPSELIGITLFEQE